MTNLLYKDDTLIFLNGRSSLVEGCVDFLEEYCLASGLKVNASKCSFMVSRKAQQGRATTIKQITSFSQASMDEPFEYLNMPLFRENPYISFSKLVGQMLSKIDGWTSKPLTMGGKIS